MMGTQSSPMVRFLRAVSTASFFGNDSQLVSNENMFHLHHEAFYQADIPFRNTQNRSNGF
jgi:hypothetical protein